jgi:hypothetical protein
MTGWDAGLICKQGSVEPLRVRKLEQKLFEQATQLRARDAELLALRRDLAELKETLQQMAKKSK